MKGFLLPALLTLPLVLAACSAIATPLPPDPQPAPVSDITASPTDNPSPIPMLLPETSGSAAMTRTDQQGAVVVEVTPLNLDGSADTLEFDIAMNTHSIDLSMDLAALAMLATDTGLSVQAAAWQAPGGGHHVSGRLVFPAIKDGKSILEGARKLTLTILNVDAVSRVFEWDL